MALVPECKCLIASSPVDGFVRGVRDKATSLQRKYQLSRMAAIHEAFETLAGEWRMGADLEESLGKCARHPDAHRDVCCLGCISEQIAAERASCTRLREALARQQEENRECVACFHPIADDEKRGAVHVACIVKACETAEQQSDALARVTAERDQLQDALENLVEHICDEECGDHGCRPFREAADRLAGLRKGEAA